MNGWKMKSKILVILATAAALCGPQSAHAWWARGHAVVARVAVQTLPADGPIFLKKYVEDIGEGAIVPDQWRDLSYPFAFEKDEEGSKHGWPVERYAFLKQLPRSRTELALALDREYATRPDPVAAIPSRRRADGLPYAAAESYGHLLAGFRVLRQARAAGKPTEFLESNCALYAAVLAHYIGDGAEPLHDTIHTQGWVGPNPNGYRVTPANTSDRNVLNIHRLFEGVYVDKIELRDGDVIGRIGAPRHLTGDVFQLIVDYLSENNRKVEAIYKIDKRHGFEDANDKEAREMVYSSIATGASMLRDLVHRAWLESAMPPAAPAP